MDLVSFKLRYPSFGDDDIRISLALSDAELLMSGFTAKPEHRALAVSYLAAHILTVPSGVSKRAVVKVKSGDDEVQFDSKADDRDWLNMSSYGQQFLLLVGNGAKRRYGVITEDSPYALHYDKRHAYDGDIKGMTHD